MAAQIEDLLIIGAGPAGLCAAWSGMQRNWRTLVLDRARRIGGTWALVRPDMRCLSPRQRDVFPDGSSPAGPGSRASAAEVLACIDAFAARLQPRLQLGCSALSLSRRDDALHVNTDLGPLRARRVIVASGEYGRPRAQEIGGRFNGAFSHSSTFDAAAVQAGERIVVIGAGNSGAEAAQLAAARGATVFLATRHTIGRAPALHHGKLDEFLYWLSGLRIDRLPRRAGCRSTTPVINPGFYAAVGAGSIKAVGPAMALHADAVELAHGERIVCDRVVLATGFRRDTSWLAPAVQLADDGTPLQRGGISPQIPGLGFVGIPCQRTWRSGFLRGFAADAEAVVAGLR